VAEKYWSAIEGRSEFAVRTPTEDGTPQWVRLYRLADTEIVRHQKVKGDYNPFDSRWEAYGEDLRARRLLKSMAYRKQWASLFLSQRGNCALCGGALTDETGWHDHHLIPRVAGGSDALSNRVLLHPVCHVQLHANGLSVAKPASKEA
jgi:RNA-directed DNA polymerase